MEPTINEYVTATDQWVEVAGTVTGGITLDVERHTPVDAADMKICQLL